jgi:hypothetical protein
LYMYYNEIVGGLSGAQYKYETDLWQISIIDALKQLDKKELAQLKDTAIIITNGYSGVDYYFKKNMSGYKLKALRGAVRGFNMKEWRYAILNNLLLDPNFLEVHFPPLFCNYKTFIVDGVPLTTVLSDVWPERSHAIRASRYDKFREADSLLNI